MRAHLLLGNYQKRNSPRFTIGTRKLPSNLEEPRQRTMRQERYFLHGKWLLTWKIVSSSLVLFSVPPVLILRSFALATFHQLMWQIFTGTWHRRPLNNHFKLSCLSVANQTKLMEVEKQATATPEKMYWLMDYNEWPNVKDCYQIKQPYVVCDVGCKLAFVKISNVFRTVPSPLLSRKPSTSLSILLPRAVWSCGNICAISVTLKGP